MFVFGVPGSVTAKRLAAGAAVPHAELEDEK